MTIVLKSLKSHRGHAKEPAGRGERLTPALGSDRGSRIPSRVSKTALLPPAVSEGERAPVPRRGHRRHDSSLSVQSDHLEYRLAPLRRWDGELAHPRVLL